jgi:hypothetical protein
LTAFFSVTSLWLRKSLVETGRGAEKWLQMTREIREDFRPRWSFIKPYIKATYGTKVNEFQVMQILMDLKQKPQENLITRTSTSTKNWRIIREQIKLPPIEVLEDPAEQTVIWCQSIYK